MLRYRVILAGGVCLAALAVSGAGADNKDTLDSIRSKRPRSKPAPTNRRPAPRSKPAHAPRPAANTAKPAAPATLVVAALGGTPYRTLSAAIKAAKPGAKIRVRSGTYSESVVLDRAVEIVPD